MAKAVLHTIGNHFYSARGSNNNIVLEADDRWLFSLPAYHIGGMAIVFRILLAGAGLAIPSDRQDLSKSIRELDELYTTGFRGAEAAFVEKLIDELDQIAFSSTKTAAGMVERRMHDGIAPFDERGFVPAVAGRVERAGRTRMSPIGVAMKPIQGIARALDEVPQCPRWSACRPGSLSGC